MDDHVAETDRKAWTRRAWLAAIWVLVFIVTAGGSVYVFVRFVRFAGSLHDIPDQWKELSPFDAVILLLATGLFYLFDYLRLYTLLRVMKVHVRLWEGLETTVVSEFASVLTPTAELHMPASVYVLARAGVPPAKATAAISVKTMYGILWVCVISFACLNGVGVRLPESLEHKIPYLTIPVAAILAVMVSLILFCKPIGRWAESGLQRGSRLTKALAQWAARSASAVAAIGKSGSAMHLASHAANLGFILTYCFIGGWLCYALSIPLSPLQALTVFSSSLMIDYLAPVPGSIGVNEFATAYMLDPHLSPNSFAAAIVLRVLCKYLVLLPGAAITLKILWRERRRILAR